MNNAAAVFLLILFLLCPVTSAEESWEHIYGGTGDDSGRCVRQTSDGGFIITGKLDTVADERQVWLLKTDAQGLEEWSRDYGDEDTDYGVHVEQTADGGYIVTGSSYTSSRFQSDVLLLKTDSSGEEEWRRLFNFGGTDYGTSVQQTADGGYIVTGNVDNDLETYFDILLLKTDADGVEEWHRPYGTDWYDRGRSVQQTMDGGYVVLGMWDGEYVRLIKTNAVGMEEWNNTWGGSYEDEAEEVLQLPDGGFVLVGTTESSGSGWQSAWLIRTDVDGDQVWNRTYGGEGSEHGESVHLTADGGFVFTGRTSMYGAGGGDAWLVKTDGSGEVQWHRTFGGSGNERGNSVRQTADGGFIITGVTAAGVTAEENLYLVYYRPDELPTPALVAGPGAGPANPPLVRVFAAHIPSTIQHEFTAYGANGYGVNVACGNLTGNGSDEILTGPGPGTVYGPHVRGFTVDGTPLPGLSFFAYGTPKYGVNVTAGDLDGDGFDEIITGAGPGAVYGPHVRAFDYDGGPAVTPLSGVNFFAYGTPKWGVNVCCGDIDGDGFDEIITGAGPGAIYGPHVRGWNVDGGSATAIRNLSFFAFETTRYGVNVACGDLDGDGMAELVTAPGPDPLAYPVVKGWNYDGTEVSELPDFSFPLAMAYFWRHGATVYARTDLDGDGRADLVAGPGPDPESPSQVYVYRYRDGEADLWFLEEDIFPPLTYGTKVAAGRF